jgi:hypothetical protein
MEARNSETRFCLARVAPCICSGDEESAHGFTLRDGRREGMYLAARRTSGGVRWLDLAVAAGFGLGTIALRVWIDLETRLIRCRVVAPNEVEAHPALTLGGWLNRVEVSALGVEVDAFATAVVLGDDRLAAHLCDLAAAPTALAAPLQRAYAR